MDRLSMIKTVARHGADVAKAMIAAEKNRAAEEAASASPTDKPAPPMNDPLPVTAARFKQAREKTGWSQVQLAIALGVYKGAVSAVEFGKYPGAPIREKIVAFLNINPAWIASGEGEMFLGDSPPAPVSKPGPKSRGSRPGRKEPDVRPTAPGPLALVPVVQEAIATPDPLDAALDRLLDARAAYRAARAAAVALLLAPCGRPEPTSHLSPLTSRAA